MFVYINIYIYFKYIWESTADSQFTVVKDPRGNTLGRGSEITLFLKDDAAEYSKQDKLEELVAKYSEFITFPIKLYKKTQEVVESSSEEEENEVSEDEVSESESDTDLDVKEEVSLYLLYIRTYIHTYVHYYYYYYYYY